MADVVVPITIPSRSELWSRVCLAKSVLSHRPATSETAAVALRALDGVTLAELASTPPVAEAG